MSDERPQPAEPCCSLLRQVLIRVPAYLFIALVMYVHSIGPMYWWWYEAYAMHDSHDQAVQSPDLVTRFYMPLLTACRESETVDEYVNWYVDLWV